MNQSIIQTSSSSNPPEFQNPPVPLFEFEKSDNVDYFICRKCKAHVAPVQLLVTRYVRNGKQYAHFYNMLNVKPDPDYLISNGKTTVRATYCIRCDADLGFRFLEMTEKADPDIKPGHFLVYLNKLLLHRNEQELDPEREELLSQAITDEQNAILEHLVKTLQDKLN